MINPDNNDAIHGKSLVVRHEQSEETRGNTHVTYDKQVNHGEAPLPVKFGRLKSVVYNERNSNKSRREDVCVDTEDLFEPNSVTNNGFDQGGMVGGEQLIVVEGLVDTTNGLDNQDVINDLLQQGYKIIEDKVEPKDRVHGWRTTTLVHDWEVRTDTIIADAEAEGEDTTVTRQIVEASTPWPTRTINTIAASQRHVGNDKFLRTIKTAASRPALISFEEEGTTGKRVKITKTVHATDPGFSENGTARFVESVRQAGKDRWLKVEREIDPSILSTTFQEWHPVEYIFPAYLDEDQPFVIMQADEDQTIINTLRSSSQRLKVPCLFEITYHATLPTLSTIFQFKPVDIVLRTPDGLVNETGVLTDGAIITFRLKVSDQEHDRLGALYANGALSEVGFSNALKGSDVNFEFPPSSPTTSEYKALMNTIVLIADDIVRWKYNLYRRVKVWMRIPDLATNLDGNIGYS